MWKLSTLALCVLMAIVGLSEAQARAKQPDKGKTAKENYPGVSRNNDRTKCWPYTESIPTNLHICDPDRLVSGRQAEEIQAAAEQIKADTRCPCGQEMCRVLQLMGRKRGYTVTVVLVNSMAHINGTDLIAAGRNYTTYLKQQGGYFGREFALCDEDIIVFVSFVEKVVYVSTGKEARRKVTNAEIGSIIDNSAEGFSKQFADGILLLLSNIKVELMR